MIITMKGSPVTVEGVKLKAGDRAPDFKVLSNDLKEVGLKDLAGKIKLIASVPSLDTPVCDMEIHRFNETASKISKEIVMIFISMDLPFAQKRFCAATGIDNVKTYSDHRDASFGTNYGVLIKEMRLLARAIFIVDKNDTIRYAEYVKEITSQPAYDAALKVLKEIKT